MKNFWERFKKRWGIDNDWQVAVILIVFTLTGFSTLYPHQLLDRMLGIDKESPFIYKILVFIIQFFSRMLIRKTEKVTDNCNEFEISSSQTFKAQMHTQHSIKLHNECSYFLNKVINLHY